MSKAKRESSTRPGHCVSAAIVPPDDPLQAAQILHHESPWALRLSRLKILRSKARASDREQRRFSKARLRAAEMLLASVIDGADLIAEGPVPSQTYFEHGGVYLLVALPAIRFQELCAYGAELEDLEDSHDAEPDHDGEISHGIDDGEPEETDYTVGVPSRNDADVAIVAAAGERWKARGKPSTYAYEVRDPVTGRTGRWQMWPQWARRAGR